MFKRSFSFAIAVVAAALLFLLAAAWLFNRRFKAMLGYTSQVEHTYKVINQLETFESLIKDAETGSRGYLLTRDRRFLDPVNNAGNRIYSTKQNLFNLVKDNPDQLPLVEQADSLSHRILQYQLLNPVVADSISYDSLVSRLQTGKNFMDSLRSTMKQMRLTENKMLEERRAASDYLQQRLPDNFLGVLTVATVAVFVFGIWIFIELARRIRYQQALQQKLAELRQNNADLEQIAFAASHDMQEPLRKIRIFSDRLRGRLQGAGDKENLMMAERMNIAATRLQLLIADLVQLNELVQEHGPQKILPLDETLNEAKLSYKATLVETEARIITEKLPLVMGNSAELTVLFQQLLQNSIQFAAPMRHLIINICCSRVHGKDMTGLAPGIMQQYYWHIRFADNGAGFDETFKHKMFRPFQRLHNYDQNDMRRKGMGLALCRRIMLNHNGFIDASGKEGDGATIHLYFPVL